VRLGNFVDRRTPIEHSQEMSSTDGAALLDNALRNVLRRAGNELVLAERESTGGCRCVRHVRIQAFVLGYETLQTLESTARPICQFHAPNRSPACTSTLAAVWIRVPPRLHNSLLISFAMSCAARRKASRKSASRLGVKRAVGTAKLIAPWNFASLRTAVAIAVMPNVNSSRE
jgi:hypothetical protein